MVEEENKEVKEETRQPIKPLVLVPSVDKDGHAVFKCLNKDDAELLKTALSNPKGVTVESKEGKTCPIEPEKPYEESLCKRIDELFTKVRTEAKCKTCG